MPHMKSDTNMLDKVGGVALRVAPEGQEVEVDAVDGTFTQIRLINVPAKPQGWVPTASIDMGEAAPTPFDKAIFVQTCIRQGNVFSVSAHYMILVAQIRSKLANDSDNTGTGPFRLAQPEWDAFKTDPEFGIALQSPDLKDPLDQCIVFGLMTHRTLSEFEPMLGHRPSPDELYLAQIIGSPAAVALLQTQTKTVKDVLAAVPAPALPKGALTADQIIARYAVVLGDGSITGTTTVQNINSAFTKAITDVAALVTPTEADTIDASATPLTGPDPNATTIDLAWLSTSQKAAADIVINAFSAAGYDKIHQIAALANAMGESSLDPNQETVTQKEHSVGLFQLNMMGGQGAGFSVAQLKDPKFNTGRIIVQAQGVPDFKAATTIQKAVDVFVRKIEISGSQDSDIAKRMVFANKFVA